MYPIKQDLSGANISKPVYGYKDIEEGHDFDDYLSLIGLSEEPKILELSLDPYNYFDQSHLRDLRVLVILKELNTIKHLEDFFHVILRILDQDAYFVGCFNDSRSHENSGLNSFAPSLLSPVIDFLDSKTLHHLDKNRVIEIMESHGFRVVNMSEINGLVYFAGQKMRMSF